MSFSTFGRRLLQKMPRLTQILCALLLAGSLVAVALPAGAIEEKQVTPQVIWTYHLPMSELVLGETRSSGIASVLELSDGTIVAYLIESNLNIPLLFRFDGTGKVLWGIRLGEIADDLGAIEDQIQPLPSLPAGRANAGVMVLDTFNVWRAGPSGELPWKRSGDRFGLHVLASMAVLDDQSVVIGGMTPGKPCHLARPALVRLDRYGDRLWLRSFRVSQGWDFVVQTLALSDGRILGLVGPEGPAMFMGSASNSCRDRSGRQHLVWLDQEGHALADMELPRGATIMRLVERPDGQLLAIAREWRTDRLSLRFMDAAGRTLSERGFDTGAVPGWDESLYEILDLRVLPDELLLAGTFSCSEEAHCHRHSITRLARMGPNGEILRVLNMGPQYLLGGSFAPDVKSFIARSSDEAIVRVPLD